MYQTDIQTINSALGVFLSTKNGMARNIMHRTISKILELRDVTKVELPSCWITRNGENIRITPKNITQGKECPLCGEAINPPEVVNDKIVPAEVAIISIYECEDGFDRVTYGCSCGAIFGRYENSGRVKYVEVI